MKNIKIKKILVPVDFTETSEAATSQAVALAKLLKADLFLIHVIEFSGYYFSVVPETQSVMPPFPEIETAVEKKMNEIREKIKKKSGISPSIFITTGQIHSEILSFSKKKKADLIVMGTHGTSGYQELFMGSNAQRIVTLSEIPVLTLQKAADHLAFKNILIPIDNALHSREKVNLAKVIADLFKARIHIIGLADSKDKSEQNKIKIKCESVENLIKEDQLPFISTIVKGNNLAKAAMDYAYKNKCELIVINTGHESKITGIFLGAFAQQIVNHSKVPVLSFKHSEGHFVIETPGYGID